MTPSSELISDIIIVSNTKKEHLVNVNISRYNIQFPENGFFAVFETLSSSYYGEDRTWYNGTEYQKLPGIDWNNNDLNASMIDLDQNDRKGRNMAL